MSSTIDQELGSFVKDEFNASFRADFDSRPDARQMGKVSARERRELFTVWSCDAVAALMKRPDIIRRAFRGTGVGIDVEGKMIDHIPFPGFETYEPPKIDEEHVEELLTKEEAEILEKTEMEFQEKKKKRKKEEKAQELRKRANIRAKNL